MVPSAAAVPLICAREIDPDHALPVVLERLVVPIDGSTQTPFQVIQDVVADVNRVHPENTGKLKGADYANLSLELRDFSPKCCGNDLTQKWSTAGAQGAL